MDNGVEALNTCAKSEYCGRIRKGVCANWLSTVVEWSESVAWFQVTLQSLDQDTTLFRIQSTTKLCLRNQGRSSTNGV